MKEGCPPGVKGSPGEKSSLGQAETGSPCSGHPQCPEGLEAQLGATADAQCQPQNRPDRSSALRLDASSNLRQLAREIGKAWRGVTGSHLATCSPKPADFGLMLWGTWPLVLPVGAMGASPCSD